MVTEDLFTHTHMQVTKDMGKIILMQILIIQEDMHMEKMLMSIHITNMIKDIIWEKYIKINFILII